MNHETRILNATLAKELKGIREGLEVLSGAETIRPKQMMEILEAIKIAFKGFKGDKGDPMTFEGLNDAQKAELRGRDGITPRKGTDYMTKKDRIEFANAVKRLIRVPVRGKDYWTPAERKAIVAQIERTFSGRGYVVKSDLAKLKTSIADAIRKSSVTINRTTVKESAQAILDNPARIARALETLTGKERLDARKLKNLPQPIMYGGGVNITTPGGGGSGTNVSVTDVSTQFDGATSLLTIPAASAILMVIITGWPPNGILRPTVDFTVPDAAHIQLDPAIGNPVSGTTCIVLYVPA